MTFHHWVSQQVVRSALMGIAGCLLHRGGCPPRQRAQRGWVRLREVLLTKRFEERKPPTLFIRDSMWVEWKTALRYTGNRFLSAWQSQRWEARKHTMTPENGASCRESFANLLKFQPSPGDSDLCLRAEIFPAQASSSLSLIPHGQTQEG